MARVQADRVLETTTTTGTGALTLAGAVTGYQAFSAACSNGDTVLFALWAVDSAGQPTGDWETGLGTWATGGTLTRTTVYASSNSGSAVSLSAGTKRVALSQIASLGWRDMTSDITVRGTGANDPAWATYRNGIKQYQFTVNDECWHVFHMPHDWAQKDLYIHAHWSHASASVTSGGVTWAFEATTAKGFDQAAFGATVTASVTQTASTTQYQHMVAEVQLSAASPSASQLDTDNLEVDGLILVRTYLSANTMNGTPEPFLHTVDIHYQSTNHATPAKAPNFYTPP